MIPLPPLTLNSSSDAKQAGNTYGFETPWNQGAWTVNTGVGAGAISPVMLLVGAIGLLWLLKHKG